MKKLVIERVEAFEVTLPIEAPIRHSYGVHEAFTRTIVKVHTSDGLVGLAETAASAEEVERSGAVILGLSALETGVIRMRITERFYWSKNPLVAAALEMACVDIVGKALDVPAHQVLGGAVRDHIDLAAYCFYRYESATHAAVTTPDDMARHAADLVQRYGFGTVKLKAGVFEPAVEIETLRAIRDLLPGVKLRIDPNAAWAPATAMGLLGPLAEIGLEYLEDPVAGQAGMAEVRSKTSIPLSTNMCVVNFEDIPGAMALGSVDVILSDPWYWGGPLQTKTLADICKVQGIGMGMHSGIELGIGMAVMAHTGVTIPQLTLAVDAHHHHLTDDVIAGPRLLPAGDGRLAPPPGPGWGVELDEEKVGQYRELHDSGQFANLYVAGDSGNGADRFRPGWNPVMPSW
ncbi:enolase C-terminal domain-like protein [Arthrobacter sp. HY1533]|uniref:enolase C-terminal domain-like protein n=1 Tax=Arthrobacter sp. HY1533 TaxID=2970919 RepID=UPI0022BA02C1|nr:enolase C-terminal domain-like protein [Arthrobacter sp. HY1533]